MPRHQPGELRLQRLLLLLPLLAERRQDCRDNGDLLPICSVTYVFTMSICSLMSVNRRSTRDHLKGRRPETGISPRSLRTNTDHRLLQLALQADDHPEDVAKVGLVPLPFP